VHSAFDVVIWVVSLLALLIAFGALIASRKTWEDFGKGRLSMDRDQPLDPPRASGASTAERDEEIRQLLEARNARRVRRGEAPVGLEHELARLTAPRVDPALREEIRQLLEARNARRVRRGEAPVGLEHELARLTAPRVDPALREEIRQLVVARNHRRARAGKPPLDVESEIEREIAELGGP